MSSWKILSLAMLCLLQDRLPYEGTQSVATILPQLDISCILKTWKIKGAMVCEHGGVPRACLWVENAYPCGILEVVRQPFKSHMVEMSLLPAFRKTTSSHNEGDLQYAETRVFTFVPPFAQDLEIPIAAPRGPLLRLNYLSELDGPGWRTGLLDLLFRPVPEFAGTWGCLTPRTGFAVHPSEVMAAHLQALRGGRAAAAPQGRVVLFPYPFEPRTGHYLQMIAPSRRSCVAIGHPDVREIESGAASKNGAYLFVHFGLFEECRGCVPPRLLGPRSP